MYYTFKTDISFEEIEAIKQKVYSGDLGSEEALETIRFNTSPSRTTTSVRYKQAVDGYINSIRAQFDCIKFFCSEGEGLSRSEITAIRNTVDPLLTAVANFDVTYQMSDSANVYRNQNEIHGILTESISESNYSDSEKISLAHMLNAYEPEEKHAEWLKGKLEPSRELEKLKRVNPLIKLALSSFDHTTLETAKEDAELMDVAWYLAKRQSGYSGLVHTKHLGPVFSPMKCFGKVSVPSDVFHVINAVADLGEARIVNASAYSQAFGLHYPLSLSDYGAAERTGIDEYNHFLPKVFEIADLAFAADY